jgi:hypothetical protein
MARSLDRVRCMVLGEDEGVAIGTMRYEFMRHVLVLGMKIRAIYPFRPQAVCKSMCCARHGAPEDRLVRKMAPRWVVHP